MTWFVDASAIVAIVGNEDGWEQIADLMDIDEEKLWSPIVRWESSVALTKRLKRSLTETDIILAEFAAFNDFRLIAIGVEESRLAIDAARRFGKGSGHPARLNMGDCFAYACARTHRADLLYKGDDFSQTDIAR